MQNARKSVLHNDIVDVRLCRNKTIVLFSLKLLELASNLSRLYIASGIDVTSLFLSAENRVNMSICGHVQVEISRQRLQ